MNEQVMIYSISNGAKSNAVELLREKQGSGLFFYWNDMFFRPLNIGDFVFVVNKHSNYVLFTILDKKTIETTIDKVSGKTSFKDEDQFFNVDGIESRGKPWLNFIRLKVLKKMDTQIDWAWQSLGNAENTFLNGPRIGLDSA